MRNRNKPFFYEEKKPSFFKIILIILFSASVLTAFGLQVPGIRQVISEPLYAAGSFAFNLARDFFNSTRKYHPPKVPHKTWEPLELPDAKVLFAENLETLSELSQEDPLADLRLTPTPSEYDRVAEWQYLDPALNYEITTGNKFSGNMPDIQLFPPVFEHSDLFNDGPAILSAALRFWNKVDNQYQIASRIHPDSRDPFTGFDEIKSYVEEAYPDMRTIIRINGNKETLIALLQKNISIMIQFLTDSPYPFWPKDDRSSCRYLLILGYSSASDSFSYQDTISGKISELSADEALAGWYPFQRMYMVLYPQEKDDSIREALSENYFEELNLQQAEFKFRTDSELLPENPYAQVNIGYVLHQTGDYAGAWQFFLRAIELSLPQRYLIWRPEILDTAFILGYADDIDELIDPLLKHFPHDEMATVYKGWAAILRGEIKKGANLFRKAGKINPNNETIRYALRYNETILSAN